MNLCESLAFQKACESVKEVLWLLQRWYRQCYRQPTPDSYNITPIPVDSCSMCIHCKFCWKETVRHFAQPQCPW